MSNDVGRNVPRVGHDERVPRDIDGSDDVASDRERFLREDFTFDVDGRANIRDAVHAVLPLCRRLRQTAFPDEVRRIAGRTVRPWPISATIQSSNYGVVIAPRQRRLPWPKH